MHFTVMESEAFICFSIFTSEDWEGKAVLEDRRAKACMNNQPTGQLSWIPQLRRQQSECSINSFIITAVRRSAAPG